MVDIVEVYGDGACYWEALVKQEAFVAVWAHNFSSPLTAVNIMHQVVKWLRGWPTMAADELIGACAYDEDMFQYYMADDISPGSDDAGQRLDQRQAQWVTSAARLCPLLKPIDKHNKDTWPQDIGSYCDIIECMNPCLYAGHLEQMAVSYFCRQAGAYLVVLRKCEHPHSRRLLNSSILDDDPAPLLAAARSVPCRVVPLLYSLDFKAEADEHKHTQVGHYDMLKVLGMLALRGYCEA